MEQIRFVPQVDYPVILQNRQSSQMLFFAQLAHLLGVSPEPVSDSCIPSLTVVDEQADCVGEMVFRTAWNQVYLRTDVPAFVWSISQLQPQLNLSARVGTWQNMVIGSLLSSILRGATYVPLHGVMVPSATGAILLCAQSGMGKSTTARRCRAAGLDVFADDMILLEYGSDGFWAHPMPTWSLCRAGLGASCYPVAQRLPVRAILGLGRAQPSAPETIAPISATEFFEIIYCATFAHLLSFTQKLPEASRTAVIQAVRRATETITEYFAPRALLARLDGDIKHVLESAE